MDVGVWLEPRLDIQRSRHEIIICLSELCITAFAGVLDILIIQFIPSDLNLVNSKIVR